MTQNFKENDSKVKLEELNENEKGITPRVWRPEGSEALETLMGAEDKPGSSALLSRLIPDINKQHLPTVTTHTHTHTHCTSKY